MLVKTKKNLLMFRIKKSREKECDEMSNLLLPNFGLIDNYTQSPLLIDDEKYNLSTFFFFWHF